MTGIRSVETNEIELRWDGPAGLYRVMRRMAVNDGIWQEAAGWNTNRRATVEALQPQGFFRVIGPAANYAGSESCAHCHADIYEAVSETSHAHAFETLENYRLTNSVGGVSQIVTGWETTNSCMRCHTVGRNPDEAVEEPLPTGFVGALNTPHLKDVQCESCHGPAGLHVADPFDLTVRPRVEIAAQMCGGCHQSVHLPAPFPRPTLPHYNEWEGSPHAELTFDANGGRIDRCGRCHSGSSRLAQLSGEDPTVTVEGDANVSITCVVCHNPHQKTPHQYQLRNPTESQQDYFITTDGSAAAGGGLLDQYNPEINLCAQCHNHRGASWTDNARPPHHSPQYNMMLGTVGETPPGYQPRGGGHGRQVEGQCAACHMQTRDHQSAEVPALAGHKFRVELYEACTACHSDPESLVDFTTAVIGMRILELKSLLDEWGREYAPPEIAQYGALAWEYYRVGDLSDPEGLGTLRGPLASDDEALDEQKYIPEAIRKARFNVYMVLYDSSLGVHNGPYAVDLLAFARDWVIGEMENPEP